MSSLTIREEALCSEARLYLTHPCMTFIRSASLCAFHLERKNHKIKDGTCPFRFTPFARQFVALLVPLSQGQAAAAASAATSAAVRAHVPVPSQDAIKEAILKRKKLALLKRLDGGEDAADDDVVED